ncbi:MAG: Calx-beta domain protein [bacterium ADurb.Bin400]|nr:MAG: Calx-beta domain protein [bacterium ADurb.Bin400]
MSGTATNGVDYTLSDTALSFAPGETSKSIDIAIINDNSLETDETIILSLTNLFNVASGGVTTYTYTITNDDDTTETQPDTTPDSPSVPATPPSTIWYTVEATTLGHGAITPSGNNVVEAGTSITFAITPDDGYAIDDVVINGVSAGAISSYTFSNVASDQTIRAIFRKPQEPGMASTEKPVPDQSIPTDLANQTEPVQNIEKTDQLSTQISPAALVFENAKQAVGFVSDGIKAAMVALGIEPENVPETTAAAVFVTAAASTVIVPISNLASVVSLPELFRSSWYFFVGWGFTRSRRRKWGKVIELGSRIPIPFAKISLVAIDDNNGEKVINTTYTDRDGNYAFAAQPGRYAVRVTKDGYSIVAVAGSYTPNAVIQVSDYAEGFVIPDITMGIDGVAVNHKSNLIRRFTWAERVFSYLSLIMLVFGSIMAIDGLLNGINQESVTFAMLNLIFWVLNFRMVMKSSPWGEVVEKGNGQPVALALVRIMDKDARRLVKTAVSNQTGHFSVFISRGEYRVITSKTGYTPDQPIPFMVGDKIAAVNRKIEIQKVSA